MTRRLVLLATLLMVGLSGCVTYTDSYYRQSQYRDGGYYYPAQDGYGDYYQGRQPQTNYYYDSYTPFWGLSRYSCAGYYSCSPFWNGYYGRPYSGWNVSFGSHFNYGYWGWYGNQWSPWAGPGYYGHRPHRPHPRQPPPGTAPGYRDPYVVDNVAPVFRGPNNGSPRPMPIGVEPIGFGPGYGPDGSGDGTRPEPIGGTAVAPVRRADFRSGGKPPAQRIDEEEARRMPRASFGKDPNGPLPEPGFEPAYDAQREVSQEGYRPMPPREAPYRPDPREYAQPEPREAYREEARRDDFRQTAPREDYRQFEPQEDYGQPAPREEYREVERYEPREVERYEPEPRFERPEPQEMSGPSQNETSSDEQ